MLEGVGIINNPILPNLDGLKNIEYVKSGIGIVGNDSLPNLSGLKNLALIEEGGLFVRNNNLLTSLYGLENLSAVDGGIGISNNDLLKNLNGLDNMLSINGSIIIRDNDVLSNLNGLKNINPLSIQSTSGAEDIEIQNNPMLSTCAVESICEALILPWISTDIYNNAPGCDTVSEILDALYQPRSRYKTERKRNRTVSKSGTG